jgi:predicted amidohydrolase
MVSLPDDIQSWWRQLVASSDIPLHELASDFTVCEVLAQLLAVADEASVGLGIPGSGLHHLAGFKGDPVYDRAQRLLADHLNPTGATLSPRIDGLKLRVLPKLHTPQAGLTVRSMSHNLGLCAGNEVIPRWSVIPRTHRSTELNLLIAPWPLRLSHDQFGPVPTGSAQLSNLPTRYGLFTFDPKNSPRVDRWLKRIIAAAYRQAGGFDGIVLPELAVAVDQFEDLRRLAVKNDLFIVSGLAEPSHEQGKPGRNFVRVEIPLGKDYVFSLPEQDKHHRWQLERFQIERYGLQHRLDPERLWWEYTRLRSRTLNFLPLYDWLTLSVLICEDLARPDPVGDLVRAVGPNLVIALLMDGSQGVERWSSRYATALADDPGCSVLTVTSLGMTQMRPASRKPNERNIGLWKDAKSGRPRVISLEPDAEAVVLKLKLHEVEEWTADGRSDGGTTCYPCFESVVQVRI